MKERIDAILRRKQAEYLESLIPARDALLTRVEELAEREGHPIADPEVALMMRILVRLKQPERILEVGTNVGYSVIVLGREVGPETVIETIEIDPDILDVAQKFVGEAQLPNRIVYHNGAALEVIPKLEGPYDFVFIDCVKTEYRAYLEGLVPKLAPGALIVYDNLLWKGQVAEGPRTEDDRVSTAALADFNRRITSDSRLTTTILAVGDGLGVSIFEG